MSTVASSAAAAAAAPLAELGLAVVQAFHLIQATWSKAKDTEALNHRTFSNEKERFELWATNLGLHQKGHASLDYRFRDAPEIAAHCGKLLLDLGKALNELFDDLHDQTSKPTGEDDTDDSPLYSDLSDEDELLNDYDDETTAQSALRNISNCNDYLFKLSMKVRNPSTRIGSSRGYRYREIDEDTDFDLYNFYAGENMDGDRITENIDENHIEDLFMRDWAKDPTLLDDFRYLLVRLAKANNLRRRQFGYWRRHKLKLSKRAETVVRNVKQLDQMRSPREAASQSEYSKPTTATELDARVNITEDAENRSVATTISIMPSERSDSTGDFLDFPDPPDKFVGQQGLLTEFECPYCFTICSYRTLQWDKWKAHLVKDLRPYVCTQQYCKDESQLYDSFTDWLNHEMSSHPNSDLDHPSGSSNQDRSTSQEASRTIFSLDSQQASEIYQCPFCYRRSDLPDRHYKHVASHLIRIALFAMPRSTGLETEDAEGSAVSNGNTGRNQDATSDFGQSANETLSFASRPPSLSGLSDFVPDATEVNHEEGDDGDIPQSSAKPEEYRRIVQDPQHANTSANSTSDSLESNEKRNFVAPRLSDTTLQESLALDDPFHEIRLFHRTGKPMDRRGPIEDINADLPPDIPPDSPIGLKLSEEPLVLDMSAPDQSSAPSAIPQVSESEGTEERLDSAPEVSIDVPLTDILEEVSEQCSDLLLNYCTLIEHYIDPAPTPKVIAAYEPRLEILRERLQKTRSLNVLNLTLLLDDAPVLLAGYVNEVVDELLNATWGIKAVFASHYDREIKESKPLDIIYMALEQDEEHLKAHIRMHMEKTRRLPPDYEQSERLDHFCQGAIEMINGRDKGTISLVKRRDLDESSRALLREHGGGFVTWECPKCSFAVNYHMKTSVHSSIHLTGEWHGFDEADVDCRSIFLAKSHLFRKQLLDPSRDEPDGVTQKYGCLFCFATGIALQEEVSAFRNERELLIHLDEKHRTNLPSPLLLLKFNVGIKGKAKEGGGLWDINFR